MTKHMSSEKPVTHKARGIFLILILLLTMAFIYIQRDALQNKVATDLYPVTDDLAKSSISMIGDHTVRQSFIADKSMIGSIRVRFNNPARAAATGEFTMALEDSTGKEVYTTSLNAGSALDNKYTRFILGGDSESANANRIVTTTGLSSRTNVVSVNKGELYTLVLTSRNVASDEDFSLELYSKDGFTGSDGAYTVSLDGEEIADSWIRSVITYREYALRTFIIFGALLLATLIFVLIPFERIRRQPREDEYDYDPKQHGLNIWFQRLMLLATPFVGYYIIQRFSGMSNSEFLAQLQSLRGLLNLMIIGLVLVILYTLCNRARFAIAATTLLSSVFGLINYMLVAFRDSPLIATDIAQIGTAMQVADSYSLSFDSTSMWAIVITVVWCCAAISLGGHRGFKGKTRLIPLILLLIWGCAFYYTFFVSSLVQDHNINVSGFKPNGSYKNNGSALSFMVTVRNSFVEKPAGYSAGVVRSLADKFPSDKAVKASVSDGSPNVIIVMNESFSDLAVLGEFQTNEDYIPYFHSLSENTIKGSMESSVFGGSTADSEFECLTGFSMGFLPFHSVPFRSVIDEEIPSFTYYMKSLGYGGNIAFHPGMRNSYNRENVYPLLGFDKHIALEDLTDPAKVRDYTSDSYDYKVLEKEYEAFRKASPDQPFYCFNVTIQNHGGYKLSTGLVDAGISITDSETQDEQAQQFVNLMKLSDDALKELLDYYSKVDEKTVILLFGDHQPRVGSEFYSVLRSRNEKMSDLEWEVRKHEVPFMIWANYDIEEKENLKISANYIAPYFKSVIGLPMTGFDKYLLDLHETLPQLSAISYHDAEGNIYDPAESSLYDEKLGQYGIIQYNGLIDSKNRVEDFFRLK